MKHYYFATLYLNFYISYSVSQLFKLLIHNKMCAPFKEKSIALLDKYGN